MQKISLESNNHIWALVILCILFVGCITQHYNVSDDARVIADTIVSSNINCCKDVEDLGRVKDVYGKAIDDYFSVDEKKDLVCLFGNTRLRNFLLSELAQQSEDVADIRRIIQRVAKTDALIKFVGRDFSDVVRYYYDKEFDGAMSFVTEFEYDNCLELEDFSNDRPPYEP